MSDTTQDKTAHWQAVYRTKQSRDVSWFTPRLSVSLELLQRAGMNTESRIIDIGAGASTLVDDLLDSGLRHITALDISEASLAVVRQRLGARAARVEWRVADAARMDLPAQSYDLWHDRAALHFLVDAADAAAYVTSASAAIVDGGFAVIGGFAADGPERCSGLPVARRDAEDIAHLFGSEFALIHSHREEHVTPWGAPQSFAYALLRKGGPPSP
jgi:hypothetical protein